MARLLKQAAALTGTRAGSVSHRRGRGFVISAEGADPAALSPDSFVEVADYDPARSTILVMGGAEPSRSTPLHWMVYRVAPQVNAVLHLPQAEPPAGLPETVHRHPPGSLAEALEVARAIQKGPVIAIQGNGVLAAADGCAGLKDVTGTALGKK